MEKDIDDLLIELEKTLRQFKINDLKSYAMTELPETTWESVKRLLRNDHGDLNIRKVATALTKLVAEAKPERKHLENRLEMLKMKAIGLSCTRTWYAYTFVKDMSTIYEEINTYPINLARVVRHVGQALMVKVRAVHGQKGSTLLSFGQGKRLMVASIHFDRNCILLSTKPDSMEKLNAIAAGLGYAGTRDLFLSGRHIPSLLRMIDAMQGADNYSSVLRPSVLPKNDNDFTPRLTALGLGIDFTNPVDHENMFLTLNDETDNCNVKLQTLTVRASGPERDPIKSSCVLSSCDIVESLTDMLDNAFINENSLFLVMMNDERKNDMTVAYGYENY